MKNFRRFLIGILAVGLFVATASAQKLKPEEIIAKHLDSIGSAEARSSIKSQMAIGDVTVTFLSRKGQQAQGRIVMASAGGRNFYGLQLNDMGYPGEKFSYDGSKTRVMASMNGRRSWFGDFVDGNELTIKESLLGGVLSTSWALHDVAARKAKVAAEGMKKVDGKEYYVISYNPKGGTDWKTTMFFEKDTFRHARTEYKRTQSGGIGQSPEQSSRITQTEVKVIETFADFRDEKGLMLPHVYKFNYVETGGRGTSEIEWAYNMNEFAFNQPIDEKTFDIGAQ